MYIFKYAIFYTIYYGVLFFFIRKEWVHVSFMLLTLSIEKHLKHNTIIKNFLCLSWRDLIEVPTCWCLLLKWRLLKEQAAKYRTCINEY